MATIPSPITSVAGANVTPPLTLSQAAAAGGVLTVTDTTAAPSASVVQVTGAAAADLAIGIQVAADTNPRLATDTNGQEQWGSGAAAADIKMGRRSPGRLQLIVADFDISSIGRGLQVAEGTNAKQGLTAAMTAGTITVANTSVTANSRILLTSQATGGTVGGENVSTRTAGTSFTITSTNAADTSTVAFQIFEPG